MPLGRSGQARCGRGPEARAIAIQAMASGAFDDLPGMGKPLQHEENVWESMAGEAMAHRILKNAG